METYLYFCVEIKVMLKMPKQRMYNLADALIDFTFTTKRDKTQKLKFFFYGKDSYNGSVKPLEPMSPLHIGQSKTQIKKMWFEEGSV